MIAFTKVSCGQDDCDWITYPLVASEGHLIGFGPDFTDEFGELVAHAAAILHEAYEHPREFSELNGGRHVEEAIATVRSELGDFFPVLEGIALKHPRDWRHEDDPDG